MSRQIQEYEGIKEQLVMADQTMAQQHEMIIQLQSESELAVQKKTEWKEAAQRYKDKNSQLS